MYKKINKLQRVLSSATSFIISCAFMLDYYSENILKTFRSKIVFNNFIAHNGKYPSVLLGLREVLFPCNRFARPIARTISGQSCRNLQEVSVTRAPSTLAKWTWSVIRDNFSYPREVYLFFSAIRARDGMAAITDTLYVIDTFR